MDINWLEGILYGFFAGLADILPVSAKAHQMLLMKLFGERVESPLLRLLIHIATLAALYYCCQNHILRINRARKLAKIPKRRRKRPLDFSALMDMGLLRVMLVPLIFGFLFYDKLNALVSGLNILAITLLVNGLILFIPQFLPGSNKDSQLMSAFDASLMGIGAVVSLIPGISCVGTVSSIAIVRGADKKYALNITLLLDMLVLIGLIVMDILSIVSGGIGIISFSLVCKFLFAAIAAFGSTWLGVLLMRKLAASTGFGVFALYNWGVALFSFILFLTV